MFHTSLVLFDDYDGDNYYDGDHDDDYDYDEEEKEHIFTLSSFIFYYNVLKINEYFCKQLNCTRKLW